MGPKIDIFYPTKEHNILYDTIKNFAKEEIEPQALFRDRDEVFDIKLFKRLGDIGLLGITAEEKFGGAFMDATACVIVHEELSFIDPGVCLSYLAHSILTVNNIVYHANDEQKAKYLPKLIDGSFMGAMAMSEPDIGTDVLGMKCQAQKTNHGYVINGRKMWITNGVKNHLNEPADILFLYAKTSEDPLGLSAFIIEGGQKGYYVGQKLTGKLGMRSSNTAEIVLEDCHVRKDQLIGQEGKATLHMMQNLEIERLSLAAMALGIAKRCLDIMVNYANQRLAFNKPIIKFGQIQKYLAESFAKYHACRAYVYNVAYHTKLNEVGNRIHSDSVKLISSTMAKEVADAAIQVLGGYGYMSDYVVERMWRDAKLLEIGGGTIEAHQKNIASELSKLKKII